MKANSFYKSEFEIGINNKKLKTHVWLFILDAPKGSTVRLDKFYNLDSKQSFYDFLKRFVFWKINRSLSDFLNRLPSPPIVATCACSASAGCSARSFRFLDPLSPWQVKVLTWQLPFTWACLFRATRTSASPFLTSEVFARERFIRCRRFSLFRWRQSRLCRGSDSPTKIT